MLITPDIRARRAREREWQSIRNSFLPVLTPYSAASEPERPRIDFDYACRVCRERQRVDPAHRCRSTMRLRPGDEFRQECVLPPFNRPERRALVVRPATSENVLAARALMVRPLDVSFPSRGIIRMPMANLQRILEDIRSNTEADKENVPMEEGHEGTEQQIRVWTEGLYVDLAVIELAKLLLRSMQANFIVTSLVYASSPPRRSNRIPDWLTIDEAHFARQPSEYQIEEVD
jgi:hypothetical protein